MANIFLRFFLSLNTHTQLYSRAVNKYHAVTLTAIRGKNRNTILFPLKNMMDRFIIHSKDQGGKKSVNYHTFYTTVSSLLKHFLTTLPTPTRSKHLTVSQCYASYQWEENAAHLGRFLGISSENHE